MGVLLSFQLLNVMVAVGGVIFVAFLVASMVLMPAWMAAMVIVALVILLLDIVQQVSQTCLKYVGYAVLLLLYLASFSLNWYLAFGPYMLFGAGAVGVGLFYLSMATVKLLVKADAHAANFVTRANPTEEHEEILSDECMVRFALSKGTDTSVLLPHVLMTRRVWVAALYFAVLKVVVGVLSAAALVCTVILPALVIFSGGDAPIIGNQSTFHDNRVVYVVSSLLMWFTGAVGLTVVTALSVNFTTRVCGEWKSEEKETQKQGECEVDVGIPVTPENGSSTMDFTKLESGTAAAASGAVTAL